jgi:hypothetical protein
MSFDYGDIASTADELLTEYGQSCILGSAPDGDYDPSTATADFESVSHPATAAIFAYPQRYIDGTLIRVGDKRALVSPVGLTVDPKPGDTLTDAAGALFQVIDAKAIAPAGTTVLWTLQVRK